LKGSEELNTEKLDSIVNDYKLGVEADDMAKKYGFTRQGMTSFYHGLFVIGIITEEEKAERNRIIRQKNFRKINYERDEKIRKLYEAGESLERIAQKFALTESGVCSLVHRNEYKRNITPYPDNLIQDLLKNKDMSDFGFCKDISDFEFCWEIVQEIISGFSEREQFVILEKYKNGKTYAEIGELLGVSRQFAKDICKRSFKKILIRYEEKMEEV